MEGQPSGREVPEVSGLSDNVEAWCPREWILGPYLGSSAADKASPGSLTEGVQSPIARDGARRACKKLCGRLRICNKDQ